MDGGSHAARQDRHRFSARAHIGVASRSHYCPGAESRTRARSDHRAAPDDPSRCSAAAPRPPRASCAARRPRYRCGTDPLAQTGRAERRRAAGAAVFWPIAAPDAFEDMIGYAFWPREYGRQFWSHGPGDILRAMTAPTAAFAAEADEPSPRRRLTTALVILRPCRRLRPRHMHRAGQGPGDAAARPHRPDDHAHTGTAARARQTCARPCAPPSTAKRPPAAAICPPHSRNACAP